MPTRNHVDFIAQAIASVLAQGIDGLELIVQDGASTDGTQALLAEMAEQHAGLHWVSEPDSGPADAVNRAIARARAPVIGWLNSDDLYTPGAIARALDHLDRHPDHGMVYGEGEQIDASGRGIVATIAHKAAGAEPGSELEGPLESEVAAGAHDHAPRLEWSAGPVYAFTATATATAAVSTKSAVGDEPSVAVLAAVRKAPGPDGAVAADDIVGAVADAGVDPALGSAPWRGQQRAALHRGAPASVKASP